MDDSFGPFVQEIIARATGPMKFRLIFQPLMASIFAIIAGLKDAKAGNPPYFWVLVTTPDHRKEMLKDGWKSVGKIFVIAMVLDAVYQFIVQRWVYPLDVLIMAIILAIVPYLILRGLVNRIASKIS